MARLSLQTVVRADRIPIASAAPCARLGKALDVTVRNGTAFVLIEQTHFERDTSLYAYELYTCGGPEWRQIAANVNATHVVGVLGGEPVLARQERDTLFFFRAKRTEALEFKGDVHRMVQTTGALWMVSMLNGVVWRLELADDQLALVRSDAAAFKRARDAAHELVATAHRLPFACRSMRMRMPELLDAIGASNRYAERSLVDFADGTLSDVNSQALNAIVDGMCGVILWIDSGCLRVLRGALRPSLVWMAESHRFYTPTERARAVAIMLCLRRGHVRFGAVSARLVGRLIAHIMA